MAKVTETKPKPRHILQLTSEEKRKFLNSFDNVFSDIDGVVWDLETGIPGSADGFEAIRKAGKKLDFITNNSVRPLKSYEKRFKDMNLDIDVSEVINPAKSVVEYLKDIKFNGLIYVIAGTTFKNYFKDAGLKYIDGPNEIIQESAVEVLTHAFDRQNVDAVVIDVDFNMSSLKLIKAHVYLKNPKCLLIAGATDLYLPVTKEWNILGPGHFANILDVSTKQNMITLGKPGKALADKIIKQYKITNPKRTLMIGDMLQQDIGFGKLCGFQTLLVLSGGCSLKEMEEETNQNQIPDYYADCVGDFINFMDDLKKANV
ncbi:glycerol-3-phosphate phosphatase-like [Teleopsis dalmanni]|uniref:glycerol-3-phosphate phosphatase-like n=1 Tax=Teleopsis dalmanni TaxID=139649 RepID=UPI000D32CDC0|nr:glycerol-3-phosphate phosphatase-like [Teleopsis dalmanni]